MLKREQDPHLAFTKSIIPGVEIKRCRQTVHAYKPHLHQELSLGYVVEGETNLTMNDDTICYKTGDGVIIPPMMTHRCAPEDIDHWAYIMLYIDPAYYQASIRFDCPKRLVDEEALRLINFINLLVHETDADVLENTLIELLLAFGKDLEVAASDDMELIHQYIIEHATSPISLGQIETLFGINKFSLIRSFKKVYHTTPAAFQLQCKVARAKQLLSEEMPVLDICSLLNFYDQAHFIRVFKQMNGITPQRYVKQLKDSSISYNTP